MSEEKLKNELIDLRRDAHFGKMVFEYLKNASPCHVEGHNTSWAYDFLVKLFGQLEAYERIIGRINIKTIIDQKEIKCVKCGKVLPPLGIGEGNICKSGYLCRKCFKLKVEPKQ